MTFALTVPGTDVALIECDGKLFTENTAHDRRGDTASAGAAFNKTAEGVWDLLRPERRSTLDRFAADYATVRRAEQREMSAAEIRALPVVAPNHPLADMWRQRAESYRQFTAAIAGRDVGRVADVGAGCGWLAADLCRNGWRAAAVDVTVNGGDGLAAARHHGLDILLIRAEMEALPFATSSLDMAVFNASLHYAVDASAALAEAGRVVGPGGAIVVLDSPVYNDPAAGHAMITEFAQHVRRDFGIDPAMHEGRGFLTPTDLDGLDFARIDSPTGVRARLHRWRGARRAGREIAQRPLLLATVGA